jgi:hypothetical protein
MPASIEPGLEDEVAKLMRGREDRVICASFVSKLNANHKKDRRLLIATEKSADLFRPKGTVFSKSLELSQSFAWFGLQQIRSAGAGAVTLSFRADELTFQHECCARILDAVLRHLRLVLFDVEFPMVAVEGYVAPPPSADPLRAHYRLRARILASGAAAAGGLETAFSLFLLSGAPALDVAELAPGAHLALLLESLACAPWVRAVAVPAVPEPLWELAAQFLAAAPHVEHFATAHPVDDGFAAFAQRLADRCPPRLVGLGFSGARFGAGAIADLARVYTRQMLTTLSLAGGLDAQQMPALFQGLVYARALRSLALDRVQGFPMKQLFARLEILETLALTHCDIEVPVFLKGAGRSKNFAVRALDLSGNEASAGFGTTFVFPPSIQKLTVNSVSFTRESFAATVRHCLAAHSLVSLSMQNVGLAGAEVERAFNLVAVHPELRGTAFALREFFWDNNEVTPSFFKVLERCPGLQLLSLNGSLAGADQSVPLLAEFLAVDTGLRELRICGTIQRSLTGWQIGKVLEPLKAYNRTLLRIDLSHNVLDTKTLDEIADFLLRNRVITRIQFQNCKLPDMAPLEAFLSRVATRGAPIEIPLPRVDLEEMYAKGVVTAEAITALVATLGRLAVGDSSIAIPPETQQAPTPPVPSYRGEQQGAQHAQDGDAADEWEIAYEAVPPVDNSAIMLEFREEFTIEKLLVKVKGAT